MAARVIISWASLPSHAWKGATSWFPKSPNSSDQKRKWKFLSTQIYQVVLVIKDNLCWDSFYLFLFWIYKSWIQGFPFYSITFSLNGRQALWGATIAIFIIEICLTIEFFQTIDVYLLIKFSFVLDIFLSIIEIYLSNIHHNELNTNKSINRKISIILRAKFNRIMLKEIFAQKYHF